MGEPDPRESVFPNWYDLSVKYQGYETKGTFGTFHVVNTHDSQKPFAIKLLKTVDDKDEPDKFVCESVDAEESEFELVKVAKPKETKPDDGAPKRLTKVKYIDPLSDFGGARAQLMRRLQVLKSIKSKSVMVFRGYQESQGQLWYMSDYNNKRSVLDESRWLGRPLKEDECCQLVVGMLRGLTYLRFRRIVHGNIKASNVFRDADGLGVLGDFRLPSIQKFDDLAKPDVSLHFMSPELLLSKGAEASPKSDLWALACTVCQLMTRLPPHSEKSRAELEAEYSKKPWPERPQLPRLALDFCTDFLATCFTETKKRPTAELLQAHPWVAGDLSPGLSHVELTGNLLSDWQNKTLIGVYAPSDAKIPGADLKRPIYKHFKNRVYIFFFEATASWQVAEMKDLGRPRAVLYCQDDVRWPQLIGKNFKGWSKKDQNWIEVEDCSVDVFYVAED